ncbi:hypothetical protein [Actinoplanes sp. GCM10030250]|uniref:hypothetical protein n=1 Tax=Actinoplanes sp. GCM10030250 TaxID=3273376 RepID=UPI0036108BAB
MAKLATFVIAAVAGGVLGVVGVLATVGAVSPSAEHVASTTGTTADLESSVYGTR